MADQDPEHDAANVTEERAAALRFHQIRHLERALGKLDAKIVVAKDKLATLKEEREMLLAQILSAARDENELPLFTDL